MVMPASVFHGRRCQLRGHGREDFKLGRDFALIVIATTHDGNVVQRHASLGAGLKQLGGRAEVINGLAVDS